MAKSILLLPLGKDLGKREERRTAFCFYLLIHLTYHITGQCWLVSGVETWIASSFLGYLYFMDDLVAESLVAVHVVKTLHAVYWLHHSLDAVSDMVPCFFFPGNSSDKSASPCPSKQSISPPMTHLW